MTPTLQCFTAQASALIQRFKPQSSSVGNVLKLAGGTAGSQVITVAAAPILTRLYGPESFGVLATFSSILALVNMVSSLSYEMAIAVPEEDDEAISLVWLCFVLVAISTTLTALGVALLGNQLVGLLHQPALKPLLWLLPVGVLLTGVYLPLSYWAIRRKQFGLLVQTKFRQSIFGLATNLGLAPFGTIGLLLGQILSQSSGFLVIMRESSAELLSSPRPTPDLLINTLKRYSHFGIYSTLANIINVIGSELPILILTSVYGAASVGQLAIAMRLLLLPAALIGRSVSQVFLAHAPLHLRLGTLDKFVRKTGVRLFAIGIFLSLFMVLIIAPFVPYVLGKGWDDVRQITPMLAPLLVGQLTVSTLSMAFLVRENNRLELISQFGQATLRLGLLVLAIVVGLDFNNSVLAFSVGSFLGYTFYGFVLVRSVGNKQQIIDS